LNEASSQSKGIYNYIKYPYSPLQVAKTGACTLLLNYFEKIKDNWKLFSIIDIDEIKVIIKCKPSTVDGFFNLFSRKIDICKGCVN
jgi:hypothetical protein